MIVTNRRRAPSSQGGFSIIELVMVLIVVGFATVAFGLSAITALWATAA